jgi:hypothetical protein
MVSRSMIRRKMQDNGYLGAIDWSSVISSVASAAPAVVSTLQKPKTTATQPIVYQPLNQGPLTTQQLQALQNKNNNQMNWLPYAIGGTALAVGGFLYFNQSRKRK